MKKGEKQNEEASQNKGAQQWEQKKRQRKMKIAREDKTWSESQKKALYMKKRKIYHIKPT